MGLGDVGTNVPSILIYLGHALKALEALYLEKPTEEFEVAIRRIGKAIKLVKGAKTD